MWHRAQGSQIFKQNSIILIHSKVMAFLVISLSPCGPHIIPVIPTLSPSSPCHPCHPHIVPIAPRRSPCGPHGCGLCGSVVSTPCCPHCPCGPHIIPIIPTSSLSSPHHLEVLHIIPNPSETHSTHPYPSGGGGPRISKNAIRYELIQIF